MIVKRITLMYERYVMLKNFHLLLFLCHASRVLLYTFSPKPFSLYSMSTGRATARRSEEGISYVGANDNQDPRQDNQVPPLDKVTIVGKV